MTFFNWQLTHPMILLLLPLMLLPWFSRTQVKTIAYANFMPIDPLSNFIGLILKSLASVIFICLITSLAGPYIPEKVIQRLGSGAEVLMLVDRSRSMDDPFSSGDKAVAASRSVGKDNSKRRIANKYLLAFVNKRPDDRFGFILFSNKALDILPLTYNKDSVRATIKASSLGKGLSETNIAKALIKAAEMYSKQHYRGSRTVLLVSDGGQEMTAEEKQTITALYKQENLSLYWIYMGQIRGLALNIQNNDHAWAADRPEKKLHAFFESINIPYRVFETDSVTSFSATMDTIDKQQNQTLIVEELIPHESKSATFLWVAMIAMLLLLIAQLYTVWGVRSAHL
jgi:mxaC protein